jgi:hypothetical protein
MRGDMNVMPPIFFSENVIAVTMKFVWMIDTSFAIVRIFPHSFHHFQLTFATVE